ncbi:MAG: TatD family hydrolase [Candidatus Altiarchaeota archaeon]
MLVDVHCHIDYRDYDKDRDNIIKECAENNVLIVNSTVDPCNLLGLTLAEKHDNVYCTIGMSPSNLDKEDFEKTKGLIREHEDRIVGVGEVGLDYYWVKDGEKQDVMEERFRGFIELSTKIRKPLVIHSRDAEERVIEIIAEYGIKPLLHCFSGSVEQALEAVELGCLISIPTSIAYSKPKKKLAEAIPLDSIVLESDAPFLAPKPGARNNPVNIKESAVLLSLSKQLVLEDVIETTSRNAISFYGLKVG